MARSGTEARYFSFGRTDGGRLLTVVFTVRGQLLRVISARPMSRTFAFVSYSASNLRLMRLLAQRDGLEDRVVAS